MKRKKVMGAIWLLITLGLGYSALCGFTYFTQDHLLYYPDRVPPSEAHLKTVALDFWPSGKTSFRGYVSSGEDEAKLGLVIVFHGNAGSAWHREYYVRSLRVRGLRVVLAEYPGYGGRPGKLGEKSFVADAKETVRLAHEAFGGPVYLCGESLGAGVAAAVSADPPVPIDGIIMITPWDTLPDLAQRYYWYLPVRLLARDRYDNIRNLAGFSGRVAMVLAERDEIVPVRHGLNLFESLSGEKKLWAVPGATHNTWSSLVASDMWREIAEFIQGEP